MNNLEFRKKTAEVLGVIEHYTSYKGKSIAECIKNGFVVIHKDDMQPVNIDSETFDILKPDRDIFNHTLFGNFEIPANMSDEEYYTHQILHYFSTYGLEFFGLKAQPYIPAKEIWKDSKAAQVLGDVKDLSIKVYFQLEPEEYKATIEDYILNLRNPKNTLIDYYRYALEDVLDIDNYWEDDFRSYEIKTLYFDISGQLPENPIDALRYIIYIITGNTLIIKNRSMRKSIQAVMSKRYAYSDEEKFNKVKEVLLKYDWTKFAQIFLRFKPIFLAMKCNDEEINHAINKIRKLAIKYHKPLDGLCVQNVIEMYLGEFYSAEEIARYLKKVDTRDIFKLMNSILNANNEYKVFGIRNGRTFVKEGNNHKDGYELDILYSCCIDILRDRYPDMKNKVFYIPDYIDYGLPISEKDMVNAYPNGTAIKVCPDNMDAISVGVAWKNKETDDEDRARVDIDLHLISATERFGWNSSRKNETDTVIYSGDMTDASEGAAECYFIKNFQDDFIIDLRLYTANGPVPFSLFMNKRPVKYTIKRGWNRDVDKSKQYIYDPNENIIPEIPMIINNEGLNIGLLSNKILYLYNKSISSGIVPTEHYEDFIIGLKEKFANSLLLSALLKQLGATIISDIDELPDNNDFINLDPSVINEKTLFDVFEKED